MLLIFVVHSKLRSTRRLTHPFHLPCLRSYLTGRIGKNLLPCRHRSCSASSWIHPFRRRILLQRNRRRMDLLQIQQMDPYFSFLLLTSSLILPSCQNCQTHPQTDLLSYSIPCSTYAFRRVLLRTRLRNLRRRNHHRHQRNLQTDLFLQRSF